LIDALTGTQLWAQTFDGQTSEVFAFQDRITASVASIVEPTVNRAEIERSRRQPPSSLGAYDLYLQALATVLSTDPALSARALNLIERSLELDPAFAPALAVAANAYMAQFDRQQAGASEENRLKGVRYARHALAAAGIDANTRALAGLAIIILGQEYESGLAALRHAAAENPFSVNIMGYAAVGELWAGSLDEAERYTEQTIRLNPHQPWAFTHMAFVRMSQRRHDEALKWAAASYALDPQNPITHWYLSAASAHLGRHSDAQRWREALQTLDPKVSLTSIRRGQPLLHKEHIEAVLDGLRIAGLPEG
jgi:adenylate cyclase